MNHHHQQHHLGHNHIGHHHGGAASHQHHQNHNLKVPEDKNNHNIKPSAFLSASSNKFEIGASVMTMKQDQMMSVDSKKSKSNDKGLLSTPQMKPFSLPKNNNLKVPIPSYNMPNKLLFSNGSDQKYTIESKKTIGQQYGGNLNL